MAGFMGTKYVLLPLLNNYILKLIRKIINMEETIFND